MRADGKKTLIKQKGYTKDIVKAILDVYNESAGQTAELVANASENLQLIDIVEKLWEILYNVKYKEDPQGQQWIKTPARLLSDKEGDCKSITLFVNSVLSNLGYKTWFRFVSYNKDGDFSHVYTIVEDKDGKKYPLDYVAYIQRGIPPFEELNYQKKKDYMATSTQISKLSGLDSPKRANEFFILSCQRKNEVLDQLGLLDEQLDKLVRITSAVLAQREYSNDELRKIGQVVASSMTDYTDELPGAIALAAILMSTKPLTEVINQYPVTDTAVLEWWNDHIIGGNVTGSSSQIANSNRLINIELPKIWRGFVYIMCPDNLLINKQKVKYGREFEVLEDVLSDSLITIDTAINTMTVACYNDTGLLPVNVLNALQGRNIFTNRAAVGNVRPVDTSTEVKDAVTSSNKADNVSTIIDSLSSAFSSITSGVANILSAKNNTVSPSVLNGNYYYPQSTDANSSSNTALLLGGVVAVAALFLLKKKRK